MKSHRKMYEEATRKCRTANGSNYTYNGYDGANALSMYVYDKYGVNAADNSSAHDALCEVVSAMNLNDEE